MTDVLQLLLNILNALNPNITLGGVAFLPDIQKASLYSRLMSLHYSATLELASFIKLEERFYPSFRTTLQC